MAVDKKISQLTSLAQVDVSASTDVLPIVDTSATETKKITVSALVGAGATAGISGAVLTNGTINSTTIGATTPSTGAFTTLTTSSTVTLNGGTANGVLYLNGSKVATSGSAFTFSTAASQVGAEIYQNANLQSFLRIANDSTGAAGDARLYFQNSTHTIDFGLPSTGFTTSGLKVANTAYLYFDGANGFNIGATNGSGLLKFYTGGTTERMRLDASGNLGLGVTPSAWASDKRVLQFDNGASIYANKSVSAVYLGSNFYENSSGNPTYSTSTFASQYYQFNGQHVWRTAPSGTAGNTITFTQAMTLDASGNLIVGGTSAPLSAANRGNVTINGSSTAIMNLTIGGTNKGYIFHDDSAMEVWNADNSDMKFATNNTERMRIDSSGNVGIGTASPAFASGDGLEVQRAADATVRVERTGATASAGEFVASSGLVKIGATSGSPFAFITDNTERMRIDSSGNVGIGGTADAYAKTQIKGNLPASGGTSVSYDTQAVITSSATSSAIMYESFPSVQNASFTLPILYHFIAAQGTKGASATVTNQYGFFAGSSLTGATNNYGFYSDIASASNRWNFYAAGTADNYFAGNTGIGFTPTSSTRLRVRGSDTAFGSSAVYVENSATTALFSVRNDGSFYTGLAASSPYNLTTANAANAVLDANGYLYRSTSSLRYKTNIVNAAHGLADVLKLRSVTYNGINNGDTVFGGLIAEEVHDAGLTEFVAYDKEGRPDALHYGNMVALLVKAVQELKAELEALKAA